MYMCVFVYECMCMCMHFCVGVRESMDVYVCVCV